MNPTIITRSSAASFESVCARVPASSAKHQFSVLGVHDLREKLVGKGLPFERECRVFEVCSPQQAFVILNGNITVSSALPCRISAYVEDGKTVLATIEPSALLNLFGQAPAGADRVAADVRTELVAIMEESCAA